MLGDHQDAFGHAMWDFHQGRGGYEIVERDDGLFSPSAGPAHYFTEYDQWPEYEKRAIKLARGRVLDIGCGAGRHSLYLAGKGVEVVGIDTSPLAVKVSRERGLPDARVLSLTQLSKKLGIFDTILMLGNNFSLIGNPRRAGWLLRKFAGLTSDRARIIAQTRDPYQTDLDEHLSYHRRNIARGRLAGQSRIRIRYKTYVTPWIEFLLLSPDELETLLRDTGWQLRETLEGPEGIYSAVVDKVAA